MKICILTSKELTSLLERLISQSQVEIYAPVKKNETIRWSRISSPEEIYLEAVNTREPAKGFIFPRYELLMRFDKKGNPVVPAPAGDQILFGIRPCDARALKLLERFFVQGEKSDPYVRSRVEKTTLIGVSCNRTASTCFCFALGNSPHDSEGLDLLLTEIGEVIIAEAVTEKGEKLIAGFPPPDEATLRKKAELKSKVEGEIKERIDTRKLQKKLPQLFNHEVWESLSFSCINCGTCTFLCPTCHCFDVTDETVRGKSARYRVWDSCQFTIYSRHASGHNPRFNPSSRYRNRVMDKFYYTTEQIGLVSCVGCGRCISACPAGIDIRQTVAKLQRIIEEMER